MGRDSEASPGGGRQEPLSPRVIDLDRDGSGEAEHDGKPVIHMQTRATGMGGRGWIDHLAFAPFDFEAERKRLDALGLPYVIGGIPGTGIRQLFVTGPEGLKLELQCPDTSF